MKEEIKKAITEPIEVNKVGRGEIIKFHTYRIYKSGRLEDCYGNPVNPVVNNGIAYVQLIEKDKKMPILIEIGRIVYSSLVKDIDIMSATPKIKYKDGDGTNFKLDNLELEPEELLEQKNNTKYFDLDNILEDDEVLDVVSPKGENPVEILREQVDAMDKMVLPKKKNSNEELLDEISSRACQLVDTNFATNINERLKKLKNQIQTLTTMREMDATAFNKKVQEFNIEINRLNAVIKQNEVEKQKLIEQNKNLIAERTQLDTDMVVLSKESFFKMYEAMKKLLTMIDSIDK